MSDADEYPAMMQMHARCVSIISNLWVHESGRKPSGVLQQGLQKPSTLVAAMKRRWQEKRQMEGRDTSKTYILNGSQCPGRLGKFARYFEVEARILPVTEDSRFVTRPRIGEGNIDENTIESSSFSEVLILVTMTS